MVSDAAAPLNVALVRFVAEKNQRLEKIVCVVAFLNVQRTHVQTPGVEVFTASAFGVISFGIEFGTRIRSATSHTIEGGIDFGTNSAMLHIALDKALENCKKQYKGVQIFPRFVEEVHCPIERHQHAERNEMSIETGTGDDL